jgi:secreted PhoX family phosphatase
MKHHESAIEEVGCNPTCNTSFDAVLTGFLSRRNVLRGGVASATTLLLGGALAGCDDDPSLPEAPPPPPPPASAGTLQLNFDAVPHSLADALVIPAGHTARVLYALGDPLSAALPAYRNDGSEPGASFAFRAGDHHDGMAYFGLSASGQRDDQSSTRALIAINHENITQPYLHAAGPTPAPRPADEALKEILAHGVAVFEVRKEAQGWQVVADSRFNRRITPQTWMQIAGPAAGHPSLRTLNSASGTMSRGTINNCASGPSPWGTYLTCEENWAGYFYRPAATDNVARGPGSKAVQSLTRYGVSSSSGSFAWRTANAADPADWTFRRWDATQSGVSADGSDDFRNEPNTFGYVVEIDPYDPSAMPVKRTALGRMGHENASYGRPVPGKPLAIYMGDDSRGEYLYKFVSDAVWSEADAGAGIAAGDKYLDRGRLYAAKFNEDGSGEWLPLSLANPAVAAAPFGFTEEAELCIHTRIAADAAGATRMDRPEWVAVNPKNGDVYLTLTNNNAAGRPVSGVDAANPRSYGSGGNANGHIIRFHETGDDPAATTFSWDIYLFGAPFDADPTSVNVSGLTADNDFSSPDGLWFDHQGVCWIQTDDGAYTDTTQCMMLAAIPGQVGDGAARELTSTVGGESNSVTTRIGAAATAATLRRFLVGPRGSEITGITATPDQTTLFVNIQHPGESGSLTTLQSTWPALDGVSRPRSATVVITRDDGGPVGGSVR